MSQPIRLQYVELAPQLETILGQCWSHRKNCSAGNFKSNVYQYSVRSFKEWCYNNKVKNNPTTIKIWHFQWLEGTEVLTTHMGKLSLQNMTYKVKTKMWAMLNLFMNKYHSWSNVSRNDDFFTPGTYYKPALFYKQGLPSYFFNSKNLFLWNK